jgi:hypothetical protein
MTAEDLASSDRSVLSEEQIRHFRTFGFLIFRGFLGGDEIDAMRREFESVFARTKRNLSPEMRDAYMSWPNLGPETPVLGGLLEDSRFYGVAEQLLGPDFVGISSNTGSFVHTTNWHPDSPEIDFRGVKFAIYLHPLDRDSGALRVIPGSHMAPLHSALNRTIHESGLPGEDVPAFAFDTQLGDVAVFDLRVWHSSFGGSEDRRLCTIQYYKDPATPEEEEAVRKQAQDVIGLRAKLARDAFDDPPPEYHPHWVSNPEGDPTRQRWIQWLKEWGFISVD